MEPTQLDPQTDPHSDLQDDPQVQAQVNAAVERLEWEKQIQSGAGWFFWIAGLSVLNSATRLLGGGWRFFLGLGIAQLVDELALAASEGAAAIRVIAFVVNLIAAGFFVLMGVVARKGYPWAFVVGMALYALDGLVFLWAGDWWSIAFHLFALWGLFRGVQAIRKLRQRSAPGAEAG